MSRFEDTPELFGRDSGVGTLHYFECQFCGATYNDHEKSNDGDPDINNISVQVAEFAGKQIGDCCFERIENEVLHRSFDVVSWMGRLIEARQKSLDKLKGGLSKITG